MSDSPPKPPDPHATAAEQMQLNRQTIKANRANQFNPFGSITWQQDQTKDKKGNLVNPDSWTQTTVLNPVDQQILDANRQGKLNTQGLANLRANQIDRNAIDPSQYTVNANDAYRKQVQDAVFNRGRQNLDPLYNQQEQNLRTSLLSQGLDPNSDAFQRDMGNFGRNRSNAYENLSNDAVNQGESAVQNQFNRDTSNAQQRLALRELPMQEYQALSGGNQINLPQFSGYAAQNAPPDMGTLNQNYYQDSLQNYNIEQQQQMQQIMGGLKLGLGAITGGMGGGFSGVLGGMLGALK